MTTSLLPANQIVFWGARASGKSCLLYSLGKSLAYLNEQDQNFEYVLTEMDAEGHFHRVFRTEFPVYDRVLLSQDEIWVFQRMLRPTAPRKPAYLYSAQVHHILVQDTSGDDALNLENEVLRNSLRDSQHIIITLDHSQVLDDDDINLMVEGEMQLDRFSRQQYLEGVANLYRFLGERNIDRHIAVCFTKVDLLELERDPWQLIEIFFGESMRQQLQASLPNWQVRAFCTSAAGYTKDENGDRISNYNRSEDNLINPASWKPEGVEGPFFWLFDKIERKRLRQNSGRLRRLFFGKPEDTYMPLPGQSAKDQK